MNDTQTPMIRQYLKIKEEHPDTILMYRLGDFYEMFFEDAVLAANLLDITLTTRNKNDPNPVPLCGVPYHSVEPYIAKLLEKGQRVAICEQVEDPKTAKGVVRREVTRVVTPGVVADGLGLSAGSNNFLAAIYMNGRQFGFSIADISTGIFQATEVLSEERLLEELSRIESREVLLPEHLENGHFANKLKKLLPETLVTFLSIDRFNEQKISSLQGGALLISENPTAARAAAGVLSYLESTQKGNISHIQKITGYAGSNVMHLDEATKRNLELIKTLRDGNKSGSLLDAIDRTLTAVGARKLKHWLLFPLTNPDEIDSRLQVVSTFIGEPKYLRELPTILEKIHDLERITSRAAMGSANARDLIGLKFSLDAVLELKNNLSGTLGMLKLLADSLDFHEQLSAEIGRTIVDEPPFSIREGGIVCDGFSSDLDEMRDIIAHGKDFIARLEAKERQATGISSLKIRYNKVFGYYLEVTHTHREKIPEHYIRKQTLSNAERFITPELKEYEEKILGAEQKSRELEYNIFQELKEKVGRSSESLLKTADGVASIDVLLSFARIAAEYNYCRPVVDNDLIIEIREGRHPIVERAGPSERFVPNDVFMDGAENRLIIITGPNMAGKSTVMRQTALIVLLAQIGSYVPATSARIGVVDRIFTRVGASDALAQGQSTFMVEMSEAATILSQATNRSLIIIDEIGRGTSTFDGLAIAWAIAEDLHDRVMARTQFATHYHELTELALTKMGIHNMHIAVKEWNGEVIFLRRLMPGATSRSYGIAVAKLAGLPRAVIDRAGEVLENLESGELDEVGKPRIASAKRTKTIPRESAQYHLFTNPAETRCKT